MLLEKYEPMSTKEVLGNYGQIKSIASWIKAWKKGQALLVYGPTGSGKSISIKLAAKEMGFDIVESHASDYRDKAGFEGMITAAQQGTVFGKKKIMLIEDIALMESRKSLYNLINNSQCPVILVAESPPLGLLKSCTTIKFNKVSDSMLLDFLKKVRLKENLRLSDEQLTAIVKSCNGDVRAALIDVEFLSVGSREQASNIFGIMRSIFRNEKNARALLEDYASFETLMMWIDENLAEELRTNSEIATAYNYLSKADIMRARITKRQLWNLQKYVIELLLRGLSASRTSKQRTFVSYRTPFFTKKINTGTLEKIARATHVSRKSSMCYLDVMKTLVGNEDFCNSMNFDEDDREFINEAQ
jgi:replication factor C large subunit